LGLGRTYSMIHNSWKHCPLSPRSGDVQQAEERSEEVLLENSNSD
jgi:hypothetical protein